MSQETIKVTIDEQFGAERALKKFKRLCESYGVVREYKRREVYSKPSICNKEKRKSAEKRRNKTQYKQRYTGEKI